MAQPTTLYPGFPRVPAMHRQYYSIRFPRNYQTQGSFQSQASSQDQSASHRKAITIDQESAQEIYNLKQNLNEIKIHVQTLLEQNNRIDARLKNLMIDVERIRQSQSELITPCMLRLENLEQVNNEISQRMQGSTGNGINKSFQSNRLQKPRKSGSRFSLRLAKKRKGS